MIGPICLHMGIAPIGSPMAFQSTSARYLDNLGLTFHLGFSNGIHFQDGAESGH